MSVFTDNGFLNDRDYLMYMAEEWDVPYKSVRSIANSIPVEKWMDGTLEQLLEEWGD